MSASVGILGTPVSDPIESPPSRAQTCSKELVVPTTETQPPQGTKRWVGLAIVAAMAAGVAGGWLIGYRTTVPPSTPLPSASLPAEVASTAELFSSVYLSGAPTLSSIYAGEPAPPSGSWINTTAAVAGRRLGNGDWTVVVAVDTLDPIDGRYERAGLRFYEVTVSTQSGRATVVAPPARVPPPVAAGLTSPTTEIPAEQLTVVEAFINNYLTASSELSRFLAPDNSIITFDHAPYESIEVLQHHADTLGRAHVRVAATTPGGMVDIIEYALNLVLHNGVWVVADIGSSIP